MGVIRRSRRLELLARRLQRNFLVGDKTLRIRLQAIIHDKFPRHREKPLNLHTIGGSASSIRKVSQFFLVFMVSTCASAVAQSPRSITIKMLNSKTGRTISTSEFQIWIGESVADARTGRNPDQWVKPTKDGTGEATFTSDAGVITVHAKDPSSWGYVNCDAVKPFGWRGEQWYSIAQIVRSGIAAPNHCNRRKAIAKPGEFVFFVREQNLWERMRE